MNQLSHLQYQNKVKILGHRGARQELPENTLASFSYCSKLMGISGIEFDVQLTKDNQLLITHDDNFSRITTSQIKIDQITATQSKEIFKKNHRYYPNRLLQALTATNNDQLIVLPEIAPYLVNYQHIELEIKTHNRTNHQQLIKALEHCLTDLPFKQLPITLTTFDEYLLSLLKCNKKLTSYPRGLLTETKNNHTQIIQSAIQHCCRQIGVQEKLIDKELVDLCHRYDLTVTAWTVNELQRAKQLMAMGVDAIITDYPTQFCDSFK